MNTIATLSDIQKLQHILPKTVKLLKEMMVLYEKKNQGQEIQPQEFIQIIKQFDKEDVMWALSFMQRVKTHKKQQKTLSSTTAFTHAAVAKTLNEGHGAAMPVGAGERSKIARETLKLILQTAVSKDLPPAKEMLDRLQITDSSVRSEFEKEYQETILHKQKHPSGVEHVSFIMYFWAKLGKFCFYGGIVLLILLIIIKIVDRMKIIKYKIFSGISKWFKSFPPRVFKFISQNTYKESDDNDGNDVEMQTVKLKQS